MTDFSRKPYAPALTPLQGDVERGLSRLRTSINGLATTDIAYTPADPSKWVEPAPATLGEALDRIVVWLEARHGGDFPIP